MFNNKKYNIVLSLPLPEMVVSGVAVEEHSRRVIRDALRLWMATTIDVLPEIDLDYFEIYFMLHNPLEMTGFIAALKAACQSLRHCEEVDYAPDLGEFSFLLHGVDLRDPMQFRAVHHCLTFLLKLPIPNPSLEGEAIEKFLATEARLSTVVISDSTIAHLRSIIEEWFADWRVDFLPGHGPGSTADAGPTLSKKEECLASDSLLLGLVPEWLPWFSSSELRRTFKRRSKMVLVPKTADSLRSICMEPATLQYWQKSVMQSFAYIFKQAPIKWHISLEDQTVNQRAALMASRTGEYSTLDLSAASDSVLLSLVERIFPWEVLRALIAVRSQEIELPTGEIISPVKYAPMGSSVTFELECAIFLAILQMACEISRAYPTEEEPLFWVFGDDIVCRNDILQCVLGLLRECGFIVNEEKSFTRNSFRESCGVFAYKGVDVTTPYIPRDFVGLSSPIQAACYQQRISLCNQLFVAGMQHGRAYVLRSLPKEVLFSTFQVEFLTNTRPQRDKVPGVRDDSWWSQYGVWTWATKVNSHLRCRRIKEFRASSFQPAYLRPPIHRDTLCITGPSPRFWGSGDPYYCRTEYLHLVEVTEGYRVRYNDSIRYDEWLRSAARRTGNRDVITVPVGFGPRRRLRMR